MTRKEAIDKVYGMSGTKEQHEALEFLIPEIRELREFYERQSEDQKSAEWNEEDEIHRDFILELLEDQIRFCKKDTKGAHYAKQIRTAQNWLKALKPHWKPSDEQMEALKDAVRLFKENHFEKFHYKIESLYEQLLKLGVKEEP